jgi:hypothetical protein
VAAKDWGFPGRHPEQQGSGWVSGQLFARRGLPAAPGPESGSVGPQETGHVMTGALAGAAGQEQPPGPRRCRSMGVGRFSRPCQRPSKPSGGQCVDHARDPVGCNEPHADHDRRVLIPARVWGSGVTELVNGHSCTQRPNGNNWVYQDDVPNPTLKQTSNYSETGDMK